MTMEPGVHFPPRWEVVRLRYNNGERGRNQELAQVIQHHLEAGWEPFAATTNSHHNDLLWLRRQR